MYRSFLLLWITKVSFNPVLPYNIQDFYLSLRWSNEFNIVFLYVYRFSNDIELMTGSRPGLYWLICWKFVAPLAMFGILVASFVQMAISGSTYDAWDAASGVTIMKEWPLWCKGLAIFLISICIIWVPVVAILA